MQNDVEDSDVQTGVTVSDIKSFDELEGGSDETMSIIIRNSDYEGDVHIAELWQTEYGLKIGITSKREYSQVFNELDWDIAHQKWSTERTENTDMWELDFDAMFYAVFYLSKNDIDVTIDEEIRDEYLRKMEGVPLKVNIE